MKWIPLLAIAVALVGLVAVVPLQPSAVAGTGLSPAAPGVGTYLASPSSVGLPWQAPTAVPQSGPGTAGGSSALMPPSTADCSTSPAVPLCSTLGIPSCTSFGGIFCSVNVQGSRCSAGPGGTCSAANNIPGATGAKCSVRGPGVAGAPPSFCSTVGGICSSINGGDCSVQPQSFGHCSVMLGAGGVCTTFDNMSKCSIRPSPLPGGPGTCSTLLPTGAVVGGMMCFG